MDASRSFVANRYIYADPTHDRDGAEFVSPATGWSPEGSTLPAAWPSDRLSTKVHFSSSKGSCMVIKSQF